MSDLDRALEGQYRVVGYRDRDDDWSAPITVATVQAINAAARHGEPIPPEWFQLIVSDEAHRSISGPRHRDVFDAFNCDKVGLPATPTTRPRWPGGKRKPCGTLTRPSG